MLQFIINNLNQFIFLVILLLLSAMFSGCETALFSLKPHDLNKIRKNKSWINSYILALYRELPEFLLTILLGNMIVNILYFAVATAFVRNVEKSYGIVGGIIFGVVSFCLVLIFGEITPKSVASVVRIGFARIVIIPVYYFHKLVLPCRAVLRKLIAFFERVFNFKRERNNHSAELKALLDLEHNCGNINVIERKLLESVIELPEIKVGEMMTSRVDVVSVAEDSSEDDIVSLARSSGHNKIPVRSIHDDEYVGWVNARDIYFNDTGNFKLNEHLQEFSFFSEFDKCDQVLDRFILARKRMAFVVDERGATAGILVLSDVLSAIFGDFGDEESLPEELYEGDPDVVCFLDGRLSFRDFKELFEIDCAVSGFNTVNGLIVYLLGRNAHAGDIVEYSGVTLTVIATSKRRIQRVKAVKNDAAVSMNEGI